MPGREDRTGSGPTQGEESVRGDGLQEGPAPAQHAPVPAAPTRHWQMTPQEQDMMARFRQDFLDLLPGRISSIRAQVRRREAGPARVALLSLESSSAMVGAAELAGVTGQLRRALATATVEELATLMDQMAEEADQAAVRLAGRTS